ncbi:MAG: hypothetical protein JNM36_15415 [Chitinophagales bacterium]|nr:hypothetical protein [Chitinophagales bacterium]
MQIFDVKKSKYDLDQILTHFGLSRGVDCPILDNLLNVTVSSGYQLPEILDERRHKLRLEGDLWNEEELKMHFLSIVFLFSKMEVDKKMKLFYERPLTATIENTPLYVICDALLAAPLGINTPQKPYFFLQEFKKGKKSAIDAEGQMLTAMLIAQHLNADGFPIYGCYLLGKHWYFTTLHDKNYCFSKDYDATQANELAQIIHILQNLKHQIAY